MLNYTTKETMSQEEVETVVKKRISTYKSMIAYDIRYCNDHEMQSRTTIKIREMMREELVILSNYQAILNGDNVVIDTCHYDKFAHDYKHINPDKLVLLDTKESFDICYKLNDETFIGISGEPYHRCAICEQWEGESYGYSNGGFFFCSSDCLFEAGFEICENCGSIHPSYEMIMPSDGDYGCYCCDSCAEQSGFEQCPDCLTYYKREDMYYVPETGRYVCEDCLNDYYTICERCGEIVSDNNAHNGICDYCRDTDLIHPYGYNAPIQFFGDNHDGAVPFLGVELEIDNGHTYPEDVAQELIDTIDNNMFWLTEDGSLYEGVEVTSQPCTLDYYQQTGYFADVRSCARKHGFTSHDAGTCGMHIHVSRTFFDDLQTPEKWASVYDKARIAGFRLVRLMQRFQSQFINFSRRENNRWASYEYDHDYSPTSEYFAQNTPEWDKAQYISNDYAHELVLNFQHSNTLEFRLFRGSLNITTIYASLALVQTLCNYVKTHQMHECETVTWSELMHYCVTDQTLPAIYRTCFTEYLNAHHLMPSGYLALIAA